MSYADTVRAQLAYEQEMLDRALKLTPDPVTWYPYQAPRDTETSCRELRILVLHRELEAARAG